ncbi:hypothetical protein DQ226_13875 [Dietzia maris]|uniref:Uncharacterized protein n=1 Tax=Dietzia maris TaxID=37915 RepID=A0A365P7T3_9ACTN|nr:membrane protein [Dietzia sp. UCD-THP]RBA32472.1 hypothetical protein DQ226_13875 [Dietzia maris]
MQQAAPAIQQAAQPLIIAAPPRVITQTVTETVVVDRQVVQESGGLLLLDPSVSQNVRAVDVLNTFDSNVAARAGEERRHLDQVLGAAGVGAFAGGSLGAAGGGLVGAAGTGVTGALVGGAVGTAAQIPAQISCGVVTIVAPGIGIPCHAIAAAAGPAAGAAVGGVVGAGVGAGAGIVTGAVGGAAGGAGLGAQTVPGGTETLQGLAADIVWDLENEARVANGYQPLVGNKPSGQPGSTPVEPSTGTRDTSGTVLGQGANVGTSPAAAPAPAPAAPPVVPVPVPAPGPDLAVIAGQLGADVQVAADQVSYDVQAAANQVSHDVNRAAQQVSTDLGNALAALA